jgi:hypothetical protein
MAPSSVDHPTLPELSPTCSCLRQQSSRHLLRRPASGSPTTPFQLRPRTASSAWPPGRATPFACGCRIKPFGKTRSTLAEAHIRVACTTLARNRLGATDEMAFSEPTLTSHPARSPGVSRQPRLLATVSTAVQLTLARDEEEASAGTRSASLDAAASVEKQHSRLRSCWLTIPVVWRSTCETLAIRR